MSCPSCRAVFVIPEFHLIDALEPGPVSIAQKLVFPVGYKHATTKFVCDHSRQRGRRLGQVVRITANFDLDTDIKEASPCRQEQQATGSGWLP
jgi:hypothetical protein